MSHDRLRRHTRIGFASLALLIATPALAADLAYPDPSPEAAPSRVFREERIEEQLPPAQAGPAFDARFAGGSRFAPPGEACRTIVKRRIDEDGAEVVRRVRICDETAEPPRPRYRPSFHDAGPPLDRPLERPLLPPADIPYEGPEGPPRW